MFRYLLNLFVVGVLRGLIVMGSSLDLLFVLVCLTRIVVFG